MRGLSDLELYVGKTDISNEAKYYYPNTFYASNEFDGPFEDDEGYDQEGEQRQSNTKYQTQNSYE